MRRQGRRYKTHWEYLPSLKGAIQRDANNPNMSYCIFCEKVLEPKLSTLKGHVLSRSHQHQVELASVKDLPKPQARSHDDKVLLPRTTPYTVQQAQTNIIDAEKHGNLTLVDDHNQAQTVPALQGVKHNYKRKIFPPRASKFQPHWHDMFKGEIVAHPDDEDLVVCVRCRMVLSSKLDIVSMHYDSYRHCNQKLWNDGLDSVETWLLQKKILDIFPRICSYSAFDIPPSESGKDVVRTPLGISVCVCCEEVVKESEVGRHLLEARHNEARNKQNETVSERSEEYKEELVRRLVACFTCLQDEAIPETLDYKAGEFSAHPRYKNMMVCLKCGAEVIGSKLQMDRHLSLHSSLVATSTDDNMLREANGVDDVELRPDKPCVETSVMSDNDRECGLNSGDVILASDGQQHQDDEEKIV